MRIVSLAPSNTEILFELGVGDKVVATTSLCNYPEKAVEKESIGGWNKGMDLDKVVELEPDKAFASDDLQDEIVEKLDERGVEVVQLKPHTLEEVFESISVIGKEVGENRKAEELVERMRQKLESINLDGDPRVYCEEWMDPPMVSGNWVPGLVNQIGAEYFIQESERSRKFDLQDLKDFDPKYIFLNVCGAGENIDKQAISSREGWSNITAVEEGNIFVVDDAYLNRPGPRLTTGAKIIAKKIKQNR